MQAGSRKNIYAISEVVPDTNDRNLQQFITHSKWSAREVLDHVAHDADELIGDATDAALIIDESGFAKQGKMSVGASRQYLGRLGKVDNGQVAVFGVLAKGRFATAIDTRLYLPKEWTDDAERCHKAGIPESERVFKTKSQLALEIVEQAPSQWSALWLGRGRCGLRQWSGLSICFGRCGPHLPDRCPQELRNL